MLILVHMEKQISKQHLDQIDRMIALSDYAQKLIQVGLFDRAQEVLTVLLEEHEGIV
jgi:lipopolysaccharide biosynthesis regulator YciM